MSLGLILLMIVGVLVLLGVLQRVLDRLRLTDKQAIAIVAALFVGGLIGDIPLGGNVYVNLGGAVFPFILCVYLFIKADSGKERARTLVATALAALAVYWVGRLLPNEPETMPFDVNYIYGILGGVIACLFGRSRRGAFIAGVMGVLVADIAQAIILWNNGIEQALRLGGAGAVDATVLSGVLAVLLMELVGEIRERATRGSVRPRDRAFHNGALERGEKRR